MSTSNTHKLQDLIGKRLQYRGNYCQIIDILDEEAALVLQICTDYKTIQADQFGEANRRTSPIFIAPLLNACSDGLNPDLSQLAKSYPHALLSCK